MKFDLQDSIDFILDKNNSAQLRAVELFTFLVALHLGRSATTISGHGSLKNECPSLTLKIPAKIVRTAKVLSAMKFLDLIEQDWKSKKGKNAKLSIRDLSQVREYEQIIDRVIFENGSWYKLRFLDSIRDLESDLFDWKRRARNVARIVEFSFRFEPNPKKPKQTGGVTMATDIVTKAPYFKVNKKKSQLEQSWSTLRSAAPFFYLIYVQKYPFYLKKLAGTLVAKRFLAMVADQEVLLEFFASYNSLIQVLGDRGYHYTPVVLPKDMKGRPLTRDLFSKNKAPESAALGMIERYGK